MVNFCGVFACAKRGDKDRHLSFFRLPKIRLTHVVHGVETLAKYKIVDDVWV